MRTCVPVIEYTYCIICPFAYEYVCIHPSSYKFSLSFSLFHTRNRTVVRESSSSSLSSFAHAHFLACLSLVRFCLSFIVLFFFSFPRNINTFEIERSGKSSARIEKENYKRNVILRYIDEDTRIVEQACTKGKDT